VVTNVRSPEVNADNTITFRLPAPNAKKVRVYTDMPKLGERRTREAAIPHAQQGTLSFSRVSST
jgi:hypothetical protein